MNFRLIYLLLTTVSVAFTQQLVFTESIPQNTPVYWHSATADGHYLVIDKQTDIPGMRVVLSKILSGDYLVSVNLPHDNNPAAEKLFFARAQDYYSKYDPAQSALMKPVIFNKPYFYRDDIQPVTTGDSDLITDIVNTVNIDSIYQTEEILTGSTPYNLQLISTRYAYSSGVLDAQTYISDRLSAYGYDIALQPFTFLKKTSRNNIIATKTGTMHPESYYIICAHYDDISPVAQTTAPGADDNGSGTATVIEAARILSQYEFDYTIKFILFCAEEQGLIGSSYYASQAHFNGDLIRGVLNLDMIGYDGNSDMSMEIHGGNSKNSQHIGTVLTNYANQWNLPLNIEIKTTNSSSASDHSSFWNYDYGAVMIIEDFADFTPYYHTTQDLLSSLDPVFFKANAQLAIGGLASFAGIIDPTSIEEPETNMPDYFTVGSPYPNPFNPRVAVPFSLKRMVSLQVTVYSTNGSAVFNATMAGNGRFVWQGQSNTGQDVSSGLYLVRFSTVNKSITRKVLLLR